jgi:AcrR family transcriptional regulator
MLDMAETIVVRDGWKALSVRSLGKELGLSGPALYKHFHNMDELVDRVVQRIFARFMEYIVQYKIRTREAFTPDSPFSQWAEVIADGEAYLSFWAENPQWFDAFQSRALEHDLLAFDPTIPADIVETDVHAALEHSPAQAMPPLCAAQAVAWYLTPWRTHRLGPVSRRDRSLLHLLESEKSTLITLARRFGAWHKVDNSMATECCLNTGSHG